MTSETTLHAESMPWTWLKGMSRELFSLDETPLLGYLPPFPWNKLSESFSKCFSLESCEITPGETVWKEKDAILKGIAKPLRTCEIKTVGIEESAWLVMSQEDLHLFMEQALGVSHTDLLEEQTDLVDAFHRFIAVESLTFVNQLAVDRRLAFRLASFKEVPQIDALCQDIFLTVNSNKIFCRLIIANDFRKGLKTFFSDPKGNIPTKARLEEVQTTLHIEAARRIIGLDELLHVKPGDFLFLDNPFYIPDEETSHLLLTLNNKPLFRAEVANGSLTILEISNHNEVFDSMVEKVNQPFPVSGFNAPKPPPNEPHEDEENPFEDEEDEDDEGLELTEAPVKQKQALPKAQAPLQATSSTLSANDIPLTLVVEVGQIDLTAQKLLELQPGNTLDLALDPEAGVNLVVNGRIIGKGELLKIGESIGVRVLQIGT